ncbi:MAG: glycosyltransferase family 4 protein [Dehalococcoidia bacterium]
MKHIVLALQTTVVGGMETHCVDLAAEFIRRGHRVDVIVPEAPAFDALAGRFGAASALVTRLDTDARHGRVDQLRRLLALARLYRGLRPDVVHLHTGGATGGLAVIAAARAVTSAVTVITEHDVPATHPGLGQRLARFALDRCSHAVVAVSQRNAGLRRERLGAVGRRFASVLNGVPLPSTSVTERANHRRRTRAAMDLDEQTPVIGSVVRLAEGKGLDDLLRAFALVRREHPCSLLLVGDGPLHDHLRALAKELNIEDAVRFAGRQANPGAYMDAMDVFVLAVPAGSMSIALLEAMARGLPSVITFCGPEEAVIHEETGLGAPPNDPEALAPALRRLVTDSGLRARLGGAAADHVRRHFSVERVADDLLEIYATARRGAVPHRLRAGAPPNPRPGDRAWSLLVEGAVSQS